MPLQYSLASTALPPTLVVRAMRGREGISRPYEIEVGFSVDTATNVDIAAAIGQRATFRIAPDVGPPHLLSGILARLRFAHAESTESYYVATIVPRVWQLTQSHHSRIFTDNTVVEIIQAVLVHEGLSTSEFRFELTHGYAAHEHICQYQESSYAFLSRLMEREGMYYFFEQGADSEVMVITDHKGTHPAVGLDALRYDPQSGGNPNSGQVISRLSAEAQLVSKQVKLFDYDYNKPNVELAGTAPVSGSSNEIVIYGENFQDPSEALRYATVRAEAIKAEQVRFKMSGPQLNLTAGATFTLEQHPHGPYNQEFLITELEHIAQFATSPDVLELLFGIQQAPHYQASATCIPATVQYRSPRRTPWPRIDSVVDAIVCGPAGGPYAEIDADGRYKVRVFFDESDLIDGSSSTWVRMSQTHGGPGMGIHFPLRKDTEVLLSFLNGDPDRPVIAGVVHNVTQPTQVTQANYTQNVIYTGGGNYTKYEDMAGSQYILNYSPIMNTYVHIGAPPGNPECPTHVDIHTEGDATFWIGGNQTITVGEHTGAGNLVETVYGEMEQTVKQKVTETYEDRLDQTVQGGVSIEWEKGFRWETGTMDSGPLAHMHINNDVFQQTVEGIAWETYKGAHRTLRVKGDHKEYFEQNHEIEVTDNRTETIGGETTITHEKAVTRTIKGVLTDTIDSPYNEFIIGDYTGDVAAGNGGAGNYTLTVAGDYTVHVQGKHEIKTVGQSWWEQHFERERGDISLTGLKWGVDLNAANLSFSLDVIKMALSLAGVDLGINLNGAKIGIQASGATIDISAPSPLKLDLTPSEVTLKVGGFEVEAGSLQVAIRAFRMFG